MADRPITSPDQFKVALLSHGGGVLQSWASFQSFLEHVKSELRDNNKTAIRVANDEFERRAFLHYFALLLRSYLFVWEEVGFEPEKEKRAEVKAQLQQWAQEIESHLSRGDDDVAEIISTIEALHEYSGFHDQDTKTQQAAEVSTPTKAADEILYRFSDGIQQHHEELKKALKPYLEVKVEGEEPPEAELAQETDSDEVKSEKAELRKKRSETVAEYKQKLEQQRKDKTSDVERKNSVALAFILQATEDEKFLPAVRQALIEELGTLPNQSEISLIQEAEALLRGQVDSAFPLLEAFTKELTEFHKKLEAEYKAKLGSVSPATPSATDESGSEASEQPEEEEPTDQPPEAQQEQVFSQARERLRTIRSAILILGTAELTSIATNLLGTPLPSDIQQAVANYLRDLEEELVGLYRQNRDRPLDELSQEDFQADLDEVLQRLETVWRAFEEQPEEKEQGNVPQVPTEEPPAVPSGPTVPATEADLSDRIRKISRVQHDILAVAEGELSFKLKQLGLNEQQIQGILEDNRTLLLDSLRYKSFAAANDLGPTGRLGPADVLGLLSTEIDSFYLKLVGSRPELQGVAAGLDIETTNRLRGALRELNLDENQVAEILSNLESSRFKPLIEYSRQHGYLAGGAGLANVLVEHNLVRDEQKQLLGQRLQNGDIGALLEPYLSQLTPAERVTKVRELQALFGRASQGHATDADKRMIATMLGPQAGDAVMQFFAQATFNDTFNAMQRLHLVLAQVDNGLSGSSRFHPTSGALTAFAPHSGDAPEQAPATYNQLTDEDKFLMQVAISSAYEAMQGATVEQRASIEVEIALLVHEIYSGDADRMSLSQSSAALERAMSDSEDPDAPLSSAKGARGSAERAVSNRGLAQGAFRRQGSGGGSSRSEEMKVAAKLLRTGGNPAAIAGLLLTDAKARQIILKRLVELVGATVVGGTGVVMLGVAAIANAISSIPLVGPFLAGFLGFSSASTTAGGTAATSTAGNVASELGRGGTHAFREGATQAKTSWARTRPGLESSAKSTVAQTANTATKMVYNITSAQASGALAVASILTPLTMTAFFTIIVITVIGGSMNDTPSGSGLFAGLSYGKGVAGCWPVEGTISDLYHPLTDNDGNPRVSRNGSAIDIATGGEEGRPVYTPFSGRARYFATSKGYGYYVLISTDKGFSIILAHMSAFPNGIRDGSTTTVTAGQLVGLSGNTGNSSGPHVHYEVLPTTGVIAPHIHTILPLPVSQLSNGYRTSPDACPQPTTSGTSSTP